MTRKLRLGLCIIFSFFLLTELSAQNNVYFTGLGRALVQNDALKDNTKTNSRLKASGGYTLFDLGVYAKSGDVLNGGVILRVRNEFGGFFGDGASLEFRQMQLQGLIAKKVKYEIGDIYLKQTAYTLGNADSVNYKYEAGIFSMRRDIINYENFYIGSAWRMQGVNAKSQINFKKGIESIGIRAYGGRTRETNFATIPSRYFYGGTLNLTQSKYFRIAGNLAGISDIAGTVQKTQVNYSNFVYSTDFTLVLNDSEKFRVAINGEVGASHFELTRDQDSVHHVFDDYFYDAGAEATHKPSGFTLGASYRNVGADFNSPMAQTRRMSAPANITLSNFPTLNDGVTARQISVFDPYSQEQNMYNQSISTTLMSYYIQYDMVEPYGRATPNRQGVTINADLKGADKALTGGLQVSMLSEIVPEGDSVTLQKRKFTLVRGGLTWKLNKLFGWEKLVALSGGIRTESSTRGGINPVNLSSALIDLGLDVEVIKDLHLLGGAKFFNVQGSEVISGRDALNQIVTFGPGVNFSQAQNIMALGMRYNYDTNGYFSMQYHMVDFNDMLVSRNSYKLNQLFFVFGLKF